MTAHDLRDVLREHGERPAPANPFRHEQIQARILRIRRRRRATAAGAALTVLAALGVVFLPAQTQARQDDVASLPAPQPSSHSELPETFTSTDGTRYRRLGVTTIAKNGPRKAGVTVPVTGKPLDVVAVCSGGGRAASSPRIRVDGTSRPADGRQSRSVTAGSVSCAKGRQLVPLPVPARAGERITVTFDTTTRGSGCVKADAKSPCVQVKEERADWSLAVYEWTPPLEPVQPEAPRALPDLLAGYRLADSRTGTWPRDKWLTFDIVGDGRPLGVDQICTGDLARRLWFSLEVDGEPNPSRGTCGVWTGGSFPMAMRTFTVPKGKRVTVRVQLSMQVEAPNRPVRWSVGLWRRLE